LLKKELGNKGCFNSATTLRVFVEAIIPNLLFLRPAQKDFAFFWG
jgi:hypothetical protein